MGGSPLFRLFFSFSIFSLFRFLVLVSFFCFFIPLNNAFEFLISVHRWKSNEHGFNLIQVCYFCFHSTKSFSSREKEWQPWNPSSLDCYYFVLLLQCFQQSWGLTLLILMRCGRSELKKPERQPSRPISQILRKSLIISTTMSTSKTIFMHGSTM